LQTLRLGINKEQRYARTIPRLLFRLGGDAVEHLVAVNATHGQFQRCFLAGQQKFASPECLFSLYAFMDVSVCTEPAGDTAVFSPPRN
jgi:hypothetical protein